MNSEEPVQQSLLSWMFNALGPFYGLVLPLSGLAVFIGACLVVALSRRPAVIAAYLVLVPTPFLIGIFGTFHGFIASYSIIATSGSTPKASEVGMGISTGLFTSLLGLAVTFPAYFVVALGLFVRTVFSPSKD
jgi:hypothetical protein